MTSRDYLENTPAIKKMLGDWRALNVAASGITADSRQVQPGWVFAAFPGIQLDGRNFIASALSRGASAVIWENTRFSWNSAWNVPNLAVPNLAAKLGFLASAIYGEPSRHMWMVGVTGTNGKTSCTHWISQVLQHTGKRTALLGTLGNGFPGALEPSSHTTLEATKLQHLLAEYKLAGAAAVAMEVSSHALVQNRVAGTHFDVALFTNLTHDHLDFHGSMEAYAAAKAQLFAWPELKKAVINTDSPYAEEMCAAAAKHGPPILSYGFQGPALLKGSSLTTSANGLHFQVHSSWGSGVVQSPLLGNFNASNLLGVLGVLLASNIPWSSALSRINNLQSVPGRLQRLGGGPQPLVVIDYAHTPDALEKVLTALRSLLLPAGQIEKNGQLWCVFGCGGDRDPSKRQIMGEISARLADRVILTSDNPRSENPREILDDIYAGFTSNRQPIVCIEPDRSKAIQQAIHAAVRQDIILIAGKGHEDYQEIAGERLPFSDAAETELALKRWQTMGRSTLEAAAIDPSRPTSGKTIKSRQKAEKQSTRQDHPQRSLPKDMRWVELENGGYPCPLR